MRQDPAGGRAAAPVGDARRASDLEQLRPAAEREWQARRPDRRVLSNGIVVLLDPDARRPLVECTILLRAGSRQDPPGGGGSAALLAEVARRGGSERFPGAVLDEELAFRGATFTLAAEADRTTARLLCLAEDFEFFLERCLDVLLRPALPAETVERVRAARLQTLRGRDDALADAATREGRRAFHGRGDPRARRLEEAELIGLDRAALARFHAERWGSSGAVVAVHGDFGAETLVRRLGAELGGWPAQHPRSVGPAGGARRKEREVVFWPRSGAAQAEVRLHLPGVRRSHPDFAALRVASYLVGIGGFSNRVSTRLRNELGLVYYAGAFWEGAFEEPGPFIGFAGAENARIVEATEALLDVLEDFVEEGASEAEFLATKERILNADVFDVDTPREALARIAELEFVGYPWNHHEELRRSTRSLTREEMMAAVRRHLRTDRVLLFMLGDPAVIGDSLDRLGPVTLWSPDPPEDEG